MQLWVGLGNPGSEYAMHRHNVGFMAADLIAEAHNFGPWQKKFRSLIADGRIGRERVMLLKPQTYMNDSGDAVQQALKFYKLEEDDDLTVFHDELDLAAFKVKVRVGGGLAGHNGLRSINAALGPDFRRVRIGIGHPGPGRKELVTPLRARQLRQGGDGAAVGHAGRHCLRSANGWPRATMRAS